MSARRLTKNEVLSIHEIAIARFGGLDGVRDEGMLESALAQPHMTFDGIGPRSASGRVLSRDIGWSKSALPLQSLVLDADRGQSMRSHCKSFLAIRHNDI